MGKLDYADTNFTLIRKVKDIATSYRIDIVAGSIIEKENSRYFNVCYYVDRSGQVKARYKKIHLWTTEEKYLSPGNEVCIFSTRFGKVGIGICWDLAFPEFFRALVLNGAQIVVVPSYWTFGDPDHNFAASRKVMRSFVDSLCIS